MRKSLFLGNSIKFPIVELLDILSEVLENFSYEIVPDDALPSDTHADIDILTGHIKIKETVYERACDGEGRDRMTIAHEIGHFFTICFCGFKLQRNFDNKPVPAYKDPEWQAKCFAGELMIPYHLVKDMSPKEIEKVCGVSADAATYQYNHFH